MARRPAEKPLTTSQKIVTWLNTNPNSTSHEIAAGVNACFRTVQTHLSRLYDLKKIKRREYRVGRTAVWRYTSLVKSITTVEPPVPEEPKPVTVVIGNRTIHNGMNRAHPLPDSRGQGALRHI
jgi:hypothetical protein